MQGTSALQIAGQEKSTPYGMWIYQAKTFYRLGAAFTVGEGHVGKETDDLWACRHSLSAMFKAQELNGGPL